MKTKQIVSTIQSDAVWDIIQLIINVRIQIKNGSYRWRSMNPLMLEKKGNKNIKKLRRINIIEADYNALLKYF